MPALFVYNNLKVDTLQLKDQPFPGFELLTWDHESFVHGTLWDTGIDAGYTEIGLDNVYGQIWITEKYDAIDELSFFLGYPQRTYSKKLKVTIKAEDLISETIEALVFPLRKIEPHFNRIHDGRWFLKRGL